MKTSIHTLRVITPACKDDTTSKNREAEVIIATPEGNLMMNRLRRLLRYQESTKCLPEDQRFTVILPSGFPLQVIEAYIKKSKAMRRMDDALDRMRKENDELVTSNEELSDDLFSFTEASAALFTQLVSILQAAKNFREAVIANHGDVGTDSLKEFSDTIESTDELVDSLIEDEDEGGDEDE